MFRQQHLPEPDSSGQALKLFSKIDLCGFKMPGFLNIGNRAFFCGKREDFIPLSYRYNSTNFGPEVCNLSE